VVDLEAPDEALRSQLAPVLAWSDAERARRRQDIRQWAESDLSWATFLPPLQQTILDLLETPQPARPLAVT
jgi:hypothetical protein